MNHRTRPQAIRDYVCLRISATERQRLNFFVAQLKLSHGRTVTQTEAMSYLLDLAKVPAPDAHRPEHA